MEIQTIIDTATAANATALGAPEAAQNFRTTIKSLLKVNINLTKSQRADLESEINFPVLFCGGYTVTNDHPVLAAMRGLVRDIYEGFGISNTTERTLVVGAAEREIRKYSFNPSIHYYIHGGESKDYDRIVRPALKDVVRQLKTKASKKDRRVFLPDKEDPLRTEPRGVVKRYYHMSQVFEDYVELNRLPNTIHLKPVEANTLLFEDSCYNFTEEDYIDIFEKTGAQIAYGYALLPIELIFDDLPDNKLYSVKKGEIYSSLNYRYGYSNGYEHLTEAWTTLLRKPVLQGKSFSLVVEIVARVGPLAVFKIMKSKQTEVIIRTIEIPTNKQFVKILDVQNCIDRKTGGVNRPLVYFSVNADEYIDTYNYLLSLDPKSVSLANTIAYVRRRMGGISLITKELVAPWHLPKKYVLPFALTITLQVMSETALIEKIKENINIGSITEKFVALFRQTVRVLTLPVSLLLDWLFAGHLVDDLVLYSDPCIRQRAVVKHTSERGTIDVMLTLDNEFEGDDVPVCPLCFELEGKLGQQVVICPGKLPIDCEIGLTAEELAALKTTLIDTDSDPEGLKNVKTRASKKLPSGPFKRSVKLHYIEAGPGCGKSYIIRQLATTSDLVIAPFTKLKSDYEGLADENGEKYDLTFKTIHRGMETTGHARIFVDEWTSMPYEYLACIVENNAADEVFLVGDSKQSKVRDPQEGIYIGNRIDLDIHTKHQLLINFRNPKDTVALLNKRFGYNMRAFSKIEKSIEFVQSDKVPQLSSAVKMAFSIASAITNTESDKNTVRSFQGSTHENTILYVTNADAPVCAVEDLKIVALSRHTKRLIIVVDNSEASESFQNSLELTDEFYKEIPTILDVKYEKPTYVENTPEYINNILEKENVKPGETGKLLEMYEILAQRRNLDPELDMIRDFSVVQQAAYLQFKNQINVIIDAHKIDEITDEVSDTPTSYFESTVTNYVPDFSRVDSCRKPFLELSFDEQRKIYTVNNDPYLNKIGREFRKKLDQLTITSEVSDSIQSMASEMSTDTVVSKLTTQFNNIYTGDQKLLSALSNGGPQMADPRFRIINKAIDKSQCVLHFANDFTRTKRNQPVSYNGFAKIVMQDNKKGPREYRQLMCRRKETKNLSFGSVVITEGKDFSYVLNLCCNKTDAFQKMKQVCFQLDFYLKNKLKTLNLDIPALGNGQFGISVKDTALFIDEILRETSNISFTMFIPDPSIRKEYEDFILNLDQDKEDGKENDKDRNYEHLEKEDKSSGDNTKTDLQINNDENNFDLTFRSFGRSYLDRLKTEQNTKNNAIVEVLSEAKEKLKEKLKTERLKVIKQKEEKFCDEIYVPVKSKLIDKNKSRAYRLNYKDKEVNTKIALKNSKYVSVKKDENITSINIDKETDSKVAAYGEEIYLHDATGSRENYHKKFTNADFNDHMQTFISFPFIEVTRSLRKDLDVMPIYKATQPPKDSYMLTDTLLPSAAFSEETSLNIEASSLINDGFISGKTNIDLLLNPVNRRGHPTPTTVRYFSVGCGIGNHYSNKNPMQTLGVLEGRYLNKVPFYAMGDSEDKLVKEIVDLWFTEAVKPNYQSIIYKEETIQDAINSFLSHVCQRKYQNSFVGSGGFDNSRGREIRFQLKDIFKPKSTEPDVFKVGQGISAWSTDACALFCAVFRILTREVSKTEKSNVVTDAYLDELSFINRVLREFQDIPEVAKNGVTDAEAFDANQNAFTQALENEFWTRYGVSKTFLDLYYSFRKHYKIVSNVAVGKAQYQKTSGEPGTLVNNGVVSKLISNFLLRGEGPFALVYKGDDFCKRQLNLQINLENQRRVNAACAVKLKVNIGDSAEFCGLVYCDKYLTPSIPRKLNKIVAHRFRNYPHWCEYQCSLRDWISKLVQISEMIVVGCNSKQYGTSIAEMQCALDAIVSFAHIDKEQWESMFEFREEKMFIPVTEDGHLYTKTA